MVCQQGMNRLKIALLMLISLAGLAYLFFKAPTLSGAAPDELPSILAVPGTAISNEIGARRAALHSAMLVLAVSPELRRADPRTANSAAAPSKAGAKDAVLVPSMEHFNAIRETALNALPEAWRKDAQVLLVNSAGALTARGMEVPVAAQSAVDATALANAGGTGLLTVVDDVPTLFFSLPTLRAEGKGEVGTSGQVTVGLPLLPGRDRLEVISKALGLLSIGIMSDGKLIVSAGPQTDLIPIALKALRPGATGTIRSGPTRTVGPLRFPLFHDVVPQVVGSRQQAGIGSFEVVSAAAHSDAFTRLVDLQIAILAIALGVLLIGLLMLLLTTERDVGGGMVITKVPSPVMRRPKRKDERLETVDPLPPPPPEVSPEDFDFSSVVTTAPRHREPEREDIDPFLRSAPSMRISTVASSAEALLSSPSAPSLPSQAATAPPLAKRTSNDPDEAHFEETYMRFMESRVRQGESEEGITYDKFRAKLAASREKIIAKHQCKTVKFEIYVKEDKTAIRAMPVKG